jgi:hypothetical protein
MGKRIVSGTFLLFSLLTSVGAATYVVDQRAPNAADTNPGTREAPFKTLAKACEVARAGDTVLIRPGIYRESLIPRNSGEPGKPIIFRGEPMAREDADHAIIKGSDPVSGFERESDHLWVKRPWRNPGWYSPDFDGISDDKHKASARLDEVFVNERPLRWAPGREQLEPGSFYWSAAELVIWPAQPVDDLNQQLVEVPVRWKVAGAWMQDIPRGWNELIEHRNAEEYKKTLRHIQHITIQGLHFRHSKHHHNRAGVQMAGDYWVVEDCIIDWMNAVGVSLGANHQIIRRNYIAHNGQSGMGGGGLHALVEDNYTTFNNRKDFSISWGGAGNKFASRMSHGVIRRNTSIWEKGTGIWLDIDCVGNLIEDNVTVGNAIVNAGYFYEISWDGIMRDNVAFGIRGAGYGNYGAGSVISDSSNTVSERNVFIGGDGGASILSGSRSGEGRAGWTSRDNRVIENILMFNRLFVMTIRDWQHVKPSTMEFGTVFSRNAIVQPAAGARPFNWGSRRYTTLSELEKNEPQTAFGNTWHDDWRQLSPPQLAKVHQAFGRVVKAILPEEFAHFDPSAARLLETRNLNGDGRSIGYLIDAGEPILLIDLHAGGTHRFAIPGGEPGNKVRIFTGLDQAWRDAEVRGGAITMELSQGVHLVRGLPATLRAGQ